MEILISRKCAISESSSLILRLTPFLLTALTTADFNYTLRNESDKSIEEGTRLLLIPWQFCLMKSRILLRGIFPHSAILFYQIKESTGLHLIVQRIRQFAEHPRSPLRNAEKGSGFASILSPFILPYGTRHDTAVTFISGFSDSDAAVARFFTPYESEVFVEGVLLPDRNSGRENPDETGQAVSSCTDI
jgi:hypothetical protein